jgi:hypothetical protein
MVMDVEKGTKGKNPFENFEINILKRIESDYKEDFTKINSENKFLYSFLKNTSEVSTLCLQFVLNEIINLVIHLLILDRRILQYPF